jgi:hypothetical protein
MSAGELGKERNMQFLHIADSGKPVGFCNWLEHAVVAINATTAADGGPALQRETTCAKNAQVAVSMKQRSYF